MKICIPIQVNTQKEALKMLKSVVGKVNVAEIWLDHIKDLDISSLLEDKSLPVLCVCKKPRDKGLFKGTYVQMAEVLMEAIKYGADYVDIPFSMPEKLSKKIVRKARLRVSVSSSGLTRGSRKPVDNSGFPIVVGNDQVQVIISHHDFKKTPSIKKLHQMAIDMKKRGADIIKIAVMAKALDDTFSIISLAQTLKEEGIPHILIAMGQKGILSRVITPMLGGTMMFAPLKADKSSASGQLTVKELREAWNMFQ